jgi:hypothetical protein
VHVLFCWSLWLRILTSRDETQASPATHSFRYRDESYPPPDAARSPAHQRDAGTRRAGIAAGSVFAVSHGGSAPGGEVI